MEALLRRTIGDRTVVVVATDRDDGDVHPERVESATLRRRQHAVAGRDWVMLDEVHGSEVHRVLDAAQPWPLAAVGDVLVGTTTTRPLAVWAGDCAPLALVGSDGSTLAVAHAGWRGLAAGVVDVAVDAVEAHGTSVGAAVLGPCIHPCCYEFGADDLAAVATGVRATPDQVSMRSIDDRLMLDVPGAVRTALARRGIEIESVGPCTGCDERYYSHRTRADTGRHALVAWFEEGTGTS